MAAVANCLPDYQQAVQLGNLIKEYESSGWQVTDELSSIGLVSTEETLGSLRELIRPLEPALDSCEFGSDEGFLFRLVDGHLTVAEQPNDLPYLFSSEDLSVAQRAANGDEEAALGLTIPFTLTAIVRLQATLPDPSTTRVVRRVETIQTLLTQVPWWEIGSLLPTDGYSLRVLGLDVVQATLCSPLLQVVGPESPLPERLVVGTKRAAVQSASAANLSSEVLLPDDLVATVAGKFLAPIGSMLKTRAAALAWAWLAGQIESKQPTHARIVLFGFRPRALDVNSDGIRARNQFESSLRLYRWATDEESSDRILAVRQVASVYEAGELLDSGDQIRRGAEPVYRSLRSTAVAQALVAQREARTLAMSTARQCAEAALSGTKALSERTLAALAGIGGVVLAKASDKPPPMDVTARLALAIGFITLGLALFSVGIEGPALATPLAALEPDLRSSSDLLSNDQISDLTKLRSVTLARRRALAIRIVSPITYLVVTAVAWNVAYPMPEGFWKFFGIR